jgi:hypothetical protein
MDDKSDSPEPAAPPDSATPPGTATPSDSSNLPDASSQPDPRGAELRRSKRRAFPFRQRVAFGVWDATPPDEAFTDVTFRDVSASGCSFLVAARPTEERLLVQLGTEDHLVFVQAEVVHCTQKGAEREDAYLIGCRFLKRAE